MSAISLPKPVQKTEWLYLIGQWTMEKYAAMGSIVAI
jgi:hypothetical protein